MARYILLKVEDNAEAAALVRQIMKHKGVYVDPNPEGENVVEGLEQFVPVLVRAVWNVYDYCKCETKKAWSQGKVSGLWVCATCKKPSYSHVMGNGWTTTHGRNLLPISETAPEWRGPSDRTHPGYQENPPFPRGPLAQRTEWR
jgi:hypothetical protein